MWLSQYNTVFIDILNKIYHSYDNNNNKVVHLLVTNIYFIQICCQSLLLFNTSCSYLYFIGSDLYRD